MEPQVAKGLETLENSVGMVFNDDVADWDPIFKSVNGELKRLPTIDCGRLCILWFRAR